MRTADQVSNIADQLKTIAARLVAQESLRSDAIQRVKDDTRLSDLAKKEELAKVNGLEVLTALRAQVKILEADLNASDKDWSNLGQVLRSAALPLGGTPAEASVMGMLRDEAVGLAEDPSAFQNALEAAALEKNWTRVYALALGRLDEYGTPLGNQNAKVQGLRFDCLDLPGQELVMESIYRGQAAVLAAEAAWSHAIGQSDMTTACLVANLPAKVEKAKFDRQARMLMTPAAALKKAENERTAPGDRYQRIDDLGGLYSIFDTLNGTTRFVDQKTGPAYLAKLNALNSHPRLADELPLVSPITADPGHVPAGN